MNTVKERGLLWAAEIVVVSLTTLALLPVSCLYARDLSGGTFGPDSELAIGWGIGSVGIWLALLRTDDFFQQARRTRWTVLAMLIVAVMAFGALSWKLLPANGVLLNGVWFVIPILIALHHIVRLTRLPFRGT